MTHTKTPWSIGQTLKTRETAKWSKERWEENELIERQTIFANFSGVDEGRSRVPVARVLLQGPEWEANAAFIVRACNSHEQLVEACRASLFWLEERHEDAGGNANEEIAMLKSALAQSTSLPSAL